MEQTVQIAVDLNPTVNFAMQQNEVAILRSIRLTNQGGEDFESLELVASTEPEFGRRWSTRLDRLAAGEIR